MAETSSFDYQALFAQRVAVSPRLIASGQLYRYDFAVGHPAPDALPLQELVEATARALDREGRDLAHYIASEGHLGLRQIVCRKMALHEHVTVSPDHIIIGNGSSQLIAMLIDCFLDPGDTVLTEEFTYVGTLRRLQRARARIIGVPTDEQGMRMDRLEDTLRTLHQQGVQPKFIYTLTNFHNPLGVDLSLERKRHMLQLATTYGVLIVEDDVYGDLRFEGDTPPSMLSMDTTGCVVWLGTFSKIMAAGLRLGWAVVPPGLFPYLIEHKLDSGTNTFASMVVAEYLQDHLEPRLHDIVQVYHKKRDTLLHALDTHFAGKAAWTRPKGGMFLWLTLPPEIDTERYLDQAHALDVNYYPGVGFSPSKATGRNCMRLAYGYPLQSTIEEGIKRLASVLPL
jgi:2-aminoadipate transaminase